MKIEKIFHEAYTASQSGDLSKAELLYKKCLEIQQTPEVWNNLGNVYRKQEKNARAIECYQKAIEMDKNFLPAYTNMACTLLNLERYDSAKLILTRALQLNRDDSTVKAMLIVCHLALKETIEAIDLYAENINDNQLAEELREYGVLEKLKELRKTWNRY